MKRERPRVKTNAGFSLLELLVVLAIVTILLMTVLANHRSYEQQQVLANLTQDVAISVRLAQSYGLNVRGAGGGASPFNTSYGINFNRSTPDTYIIYQDPDRGPVFEYTVGNEVETFTLGQGYTISDVCVEDSSSNRRCFVANGGTLTYLDITFDRPRPDANFNSNLGSAWQEATVTIQDPRGNSKNVNIFATGYVNAQ